MTKLSDKISNPDLSDFDLDQLSQGFEDGIMLGTCSNCQAQHEVEPDCINGWCSDCDHHTVNSPLIEAGMI